MLMFANLPALAFAQSPYTGIHVKILNIKNSTGTVACALFESPDGFPHEYLHSATNVMVIKIRKTQARCDFEDIPPGTYAMAVIHDENMNGKLDANWLGADGRLWVFERRQRRTGRAFILCRQFPIRRAESRFDDELAILSAQAAAQNPTIRLGSFWLAHSQQ
jgi:uncharacterized protein (DUF2141 family)